MWPGKPVARTGAHLGERPGVGVLALYDAVKQHHFREKYWNAASLSIEIEAHIGGVGSEIRALAIAGGPANARFGMSQARFEILQFRQKVARG